MGKHILKYFKYNNQLLVEYAKRNRSAVKLVRNQKMHLGFPPWGFAQFKETVTEMVQRERIGKYLNELKGVTLGIRSIKVLGNTFPIINDSPYLQIHLIIDSYVFKPTIGSIISGEIKHVASTHISVTIYHVFNVSIKLQKVNRKELKVNSEITVKITNFNLEDSIPFIEGILIVDKQHTEPMDMEQDESEGSQLDSGISTCSVIERKPKIETHVLDDYDDLDADKNEEKYNLNVPIKSTSHQNVKKPQNQTSSDSENETSNSRTIRENVKQPATPAKKSKKKIKIETSTSFECEGSSVKKIKTEPIDDKETANVSAFSPMLSSTMRPTNQTKEKKNNKKEKKRDSLNHIKDNLISKLLSKYS